jgi:HSP20 family molecular chaperone IbpA
MCDCVIMLVEIAGVRPQYLHVALHGRRLHIRGRREQPQHPNAAYHRIEIGYGEFELWVGLPCSVNPAGVTARYEAGFLEVTLPRSPRKSVRVVAINKGEKHDG